ncbi:MAG: SPOR domain-containing protein, partial [Cyclobacteriaceae bacterium]
VDFVDGYTIQIYTGSSSDDARKLRGKAISLMDDDDVELFYDEPNFKVKVGQYFSRLEAQGDYGKLKEEFPMAIIIPDKIPVP